MQRSGYMCGLQVTHLYSSIQVKARGAKVYVITDNARLARGIDPNPIVIPNNGPLSALIAVLPLQVQMRTSFF